MRIVLLCGLLCGCSLVDNASSGGGQYEDRIYVGNSYVELTRFDDLKRYSCRIGTLVCDPMGTRMLCSCKRIMD
jgi:hypothetical protein